MNDIKTGTGSCLCGSVKIKAPNISKSVGACHCGMCRKWGGGPFMATDCGPDVTFEGEKNISVYNSSEWAERGFCKQCGSHLFYRLKATNQHFMPVGLFDNSEQFELGHQLFIDKKPSFYSFANKTSDMTGAELFAKYAPPAD